mmetsp:Transcript_4830/g.7783  ORF Transcript_4830/g.7783 Transcript_4830/m.7783 type:complete len:208 (-) Transcript_4830:179-802(-)
MPPVFFDFLFLNTIGAIGLSSLSASVNDVTVVGAFFSLFKCTRPAPRCCRGGGSADVVVVAAVVSPVFGVRFDAMAFARRVGKKLDLLPSESSSECCASSSSLCRPAARWRRCCSSSLSGAAFTTAKLCASGTDVQPLATPCVGSRPLARVSSVPSSSEASCCVANTLAAAANASSPGVVVAVSSLGNGRYWRSGARTTGLAISSGS